MTVRERTKLVSDLVQQVKDHCMCAKFTEDKSHYLVTFPYGFALDGARVSKGAGKALALRRMLAVMEREWKANQL